jgi:MSHA biogenesis protein MshN
MSLINQMLQELEQRKASTAAPSHSELKPTAHPVQAVAGPRKNKVLRYAVLVALCAVGAYGMQWLSHPAMPNVKQAANLPTASGVITEANAHMKTVGVAELSHASAVVNTAEPTIASSVAVADIATQNTQPQPQLQPVNTAELFAPSLERTLHISQQAGALTNVTQTHATQHTAGEVKVAAKAKPVMLAALEASAQLDVSASDVSVVALANTQLKPKVTGTHGAEPRVSVNKTMSVEQQASHMYQQAISYLQQGRVAEAQDQLKSAIVAYPQHDDARQTLVGLLVDNKRNDEAIHVLKAGLQVSPHHAGYAQTLARLQLDAGLVTDALQTLESNSVNTQQPQEYHALMAVVFQKTGQHDQAITHYQQALSQGASTPVWYIGLGVSLQAEGRTQEAKQAYQQAQSSQLSPELAQFVSQRLKQVQ